MSKFQYVCLIKRIWKQLVLSHIHMFPLNPLNEMAVEKFIKQFYAFQSQTFFFSSKTQAYKTNSRKSSVWFCFIFANILFIVREESLLKNLFANRFVAMLHSPKRQQQQQQNKQNQSTNARKSQRLRKPPSVK